MKKQSDYAFIPDWQIYDFSGADLDNNQEPDGTEEEKEYRFYSLPEKDHNDQGIKKMD